MKEAMRHGTGRPRGLYRAWLRDKVGWHCNSRGCYEAFWDYDDSVTPDQMAEACANYEEAGFASPLSRREGDPRGVGCLGR